MSTPSSKAFFGLGLLALIASFVLVGVGHAQWSIFNPFGGSASSGSSSPAIAAAALPAAGDQENQIIRTVKAAQPAVASVIISKELPKMEGNMQTVPFGAPNDPFFRQFDIQVPQLHQNGTQRTEIGGGTAFFVSADGLMLTNKHVVDDESAQYTVLLNDGRKLGAKVVARDPSNDIALLKVEGSGFTPLAIAQSDDLQLGQTAIAIGNALAEFRNTVSVGVVSGLQRSITAGSTLGGGTEQLDQIIQTDAAINEGNSGGPLLSSRGEVIGMSTAVASGGQNIGFALPADELRRVVESYQKNGRIVRAYLGLRYVAITPELQKANNLPYDHGALVSRGETREDLAVIPGSPADKAGIVENDIVLQADGTTLTPDVSLARLVQRKAPGDKITLRVWHKGSEKDVTATLDELKTP